MASSVTYEVSSSDSFSSSGLLTGHGPYSTAADLKESIACVEGLDKNELRLLQCGRELCDDALPLMDASGANSISVVFKLLGGKGGFGSMLRAMGSQRSGFETENVDACRDLSGRRLRHVQDEKKVAEWMAKEREREEEAKRRKEQKRERLLAVKKHTFDYQGTAIDLKESSEKVDDAVAAGFAKAMAAKAKQKGADIAEAKAEQQKRPVDDVDNLDTKRQKLEVVRTAWDSSEEESSGTDGEGNGDVASTLDTR